MNRFLLIKNSNFLNEKIIIKICLVLDSEGRIVEKIIVSGGKALKGTVKVEGAKNAVLPILAASLLASKDKNSLKDVPNLADVNIIAEVLKSLNANVKSPEAMTLTLSTARRSGNEIALRIYTTINVKRINTQLIIGG